MESKIQFELTIKNSFRTLAYVKGLERDSETITVANMQDAPEIEQYLEHMLGYRVHLSMVTEENE